MAGFGPLIKYTFRCVYVVKARDKDAAWKEFMQGNLAIVEESIVDEETVDEEEGARDWLLPSSTGIVDEEGTV